MNDMKAVTEPKSDQLNADSLLGGPRTITITKVQLSPGTEQPVSVFFEGDDGKPYKPCKSMARLMMATWGADSSTYVGRSMTLYNDPTVKWGGIAVGGIRISHLSHIERDMVIALTATRGKKSPYTVKVLSGQQDDAAARQALTNATTLDELRLAWANKAMAPFRTSLAGYLEQRKTELTPPEQGRTDEQHGDQFDDTQSDQSPANSSQEPTVGDEQQSADGSQEEADAGAASDIPVQIAQTTFERLTDLALTSQNAADIDAVEAEFDARESEIMLADRPTLQATINDVRDRILKGE